MARIPLYNAPDQLNTGTRVLAPVALEVPDSGIAKGLSQIAGITGNLALSIKKKNEDLEDLSLLANLDNDIARETLFLEKYKIENSSDKDIPSWERMAEDSINRLKNQYGEKAMTPEMRVKLNASIDRYGNSTLANTFSDSVRQKSSNVSSQISEIQKNALLTGDFTNYKTFIDSLKDKEIYSDEQLNAFELDYNASFNSKEIEDSSFAIDAYLTAGDYKSAEKEVYSLFDRNLISKNRFDSELNKIDYRFRYKQTLEELDMKADENPGEVLNVLPEKEFSIPYLREKRTTTVNQFVPELKDTRAPLRTQFSDPKNLKQILALMNSEVGSMGKEAQIAFAETVLNRSIAEGRSISSIINDDKYYQPLKAGGTINTSRQTIDSNLAKRAELLRSLETALNGSNLTGGATDNASAEVAASVQSGGYDSVPSSIVNIGGETFYTKTYYEKGRKTDGSFNTTRLNPIDQEKLRRKAETNLLKYAQNEFESFKTLVDLGQVAPNIEGPIDLETIGAELIADKYPNLNSATGFKRTALDYLTKRASNYEAIQMEVLGYDPAKDGSGLGYATLQTKIDTLFSGPFKDRLSQNLKDNNESSLSREQSKKLTPVFSLLNKLAFTDQAFGKYKKSKEYAFEEPEEVLSKGVDWLPDWKMFGAEFKPVESAPIMTTPDIEVKMPDGSIKKIKGAPVPVEEVDPEKRTEISMIVEQKKEEIREILKANPNLSTDELLRKVSEMIGKDLDISSGTGTPNIQIKTPGNIDALRKSLQSLPPLPK